MKILILGGTGLLGAELYKYLKSKNCNVSVLSRKTNPKNDFYNKNFIKNIEALSPNILINCIAYTNVDKAEKFKKNARQLNEALPNKLSLLAKKNNYLLIHFSTDYIFSSDKLRSFIENSKKNPINYYGKTKLEGEKKIYLAKCDYFIFRVSWLYGYHKKNFFLNLLNTKKNNLNIVNDQFSTPTSVNFVSKYVFKFIKKYKENKNFKNITSHIVPSGFCNKYQFANKIFELHKKIDKKFIKNDIKIFQVKSSLYNSAADRPYCSNLDNKSLGKIFNHKIVNWKTDLKYYINNNQ